jgi:hypothetical protein
MKFYSINGPVVIQYIVLVHKVSFSIIEVVVMVIGLVVQLWILNDFFLKKLKKLCFFKIINKINN